MPRPTTSTTLAPSPARRIAMSKFRENLSAVMKRTVAQDRENVIVEVAGVPVGVVITMDEYEDYLDLRDPAINARVVQGIRAFQAGKATRTRDLLAEISTPRPRQRARKK